VKLKALQYGPFAPVIRAAPANRAWMDAFPDRHAYRCLPLSISNTFGWEILSPCDLVVEWTGGPDADDLTVSSLDDYPLLSHFASSNFTRGIVTMHVGYIFRTEPGWSLLATGPLNEPIDGLSPLTGVTETDWLPYPFTMNWQMTRPGRVVIAKGQAFCHIYPIRQDALEETQVELLGIEAEEGLRERQDAFAARRTLLRTAQADPKPGERVEAWGREYFRGKLVDGPQAPRHTHKMRLAEPVDLREPKPDFVAAARTVAAGGLVTSKVQSRFQPWGEVAAPANAAPAAEAPRQAASTVASAVKPRATGWWSGDPQTLPLVEPRAAQGIMVVENFLSPEQCGLIQEAFRASMANLAPNATDSFWDERLIYFHQIDASAHRAKSIMQQARYVAAYRIAEHFGATRPLYTDSQQLVLWNEGHSMPVHVDNAHPDGSAHGTPHREYASVLYLNDDYQGGEIYFPKQGYRLRPRTGMLVAFPGSDEAPHGVTAVLKGERLTMPAWYTTERAVAEAAMFTIF
jgi:predicted 2-oxoglutarate/Fe(II)-dependent dioxygenase YbiX